MRFNFHSTKRTHRCVPFPTATSLSLSFPLLFPPFPLPTFHTISAHFVDYEKRNACGIVDPLSFFLLFLFALHSIWTRIHSHGVIECMLLNALQQQKHIMCCSMAKMNQMNCLNRIEHLNCCPDDTCWKCPTCSFMMLRMSTIYSYRGTTYEYS